MGDAINISHVQNSIVNIKGTLQGASMALGVAPLASSNKDELISLLAQLEAALTKEAADKPDSTEAISDAAKETMEKISRDKPNKRAIESATKGFLDLAKDVTEALPVATKIATLIAGMFGFTL